jgi:hypothetical protein
MKAQQITDKQLAERCSRIQPIVRDRFGGLRFIKPVNPNNIAYQWDPAFMGTVPRKLIIVGRSKRVLITWAYYGFFKPTIRECLAQMPPGCVNRCTAFEIVKGPKTAADLNVEKEALNAGYHICEVVYYMAAK